MDNLVANLLDFFTDAGKSLGTKSASAIVIITALLIFDYLTGLSYHFQTSSKLDELQKISDLRLSYSNDTIKTLKLKEIESEVINKKHYYSWLNFIFSTKKANKSSTVEKIAVNNVEKGKLSILNIYWMILSSSYALIFVLISFLFTPIFIYKNIDKNVLISMLAFMIIIIVMIATSTSIAYLLPVINEKKPFWNYLLNMLIHSVFVLGFIVWVNKQSKDNAKE